MSVFILYLFHSIKKKVLLSFERVETLLMFEKSLISLGSLPKAYFPGLIWNALAPNVPYLVKWS